MFIDVEAELSGDEDSGEGSLPSGLSSLVLQLGTRVCGLCLGRGCCMFAVARHKLLCPVVLKCLPCCATEATLPTSLWNMAWLVFLPALSPLVPSLHHSTSSTRKVASSLPLQPPPRPLRKSWHDLGQGTKTL